MAFTFTSDLFLGLLGCFVPPLTVWIKRGFWNSDFLINCCLTLLGLPGIIHAWYIVVKYPDDGLPFMVNHIGNQSSGYIRVGDEESQIDTPPPSNAEEDNLYHHQATTGEGSSQNPPQYEELSAPRHPIGVDNKVQSNEDRL